LRRVAVPSSLTPVTAKRKTRCGCRETREFVVNIVTYELREAMNLTSGEYDASVDEFSWRSLPRAVEDRAPAASRRISVSFECKLHQILDFSPRPTSGSLVIGQIVSIHINECAY